MSLYFVGSCFPKVLWNQQRKGDRPLALAGPSCPSRTVTEAAAGDPRQLPCLAAPKFDAACSLRCGWRSLAAPWLLEGVTA